MAKSEDKAAKEAAPERLASMGWEEDPRYDNAQKEQVLELWAELGEANVRAVPAHQTLTLSQIRAAIKGDA